MKITFNYKDLIKNVLILLFTVTLGLGIGFYYGFLSGQEFYNKWLVLSSWNDGYMQGHVEGSSATLYLIFEEYLNKHPYDWSIDEK